MTLQSAADTSYGIDEAQRAFACIVAFDTTLRNQSTLVLGIALRSAIGGAASDDEDSTGSSEHGGLDEDPISVEKDDGKVIGQVFKRSVLRVLPGADPVSLS